ncbi:MAG: YdcF family protein [Archangium sp.]
MIALAITCTVLIALVLFLAAQVRRLGAAHFAAPPLKTAVVLGARVYADGVASDALVDRVRVGVALLKEGRVERLILTGGSPDHRPTEADVMAKIARELGAPAEALVLETKSRSTFDNARFSVALLEPSEREIVLVTCDFHVARALAQFRAHRLTVWPAPSPRVLDTSTRLMVTFKEVIGLLRRPWLLRGLRQPDPRMGR